MTPKLNLPSDCDAGQHLAGTIIYLIVGYLFAMMTGVAAVSSGFAPALIPLVATLCFTAKSYFEIIRFAHSLQVYYLWRRSNIRQGGRP